MRKHKLINHDDNCPHEGHCLICDGGLSVCEVCTGAETDLPTECLGRKMTDNEKICIANGDDYIGGRWARVSP